MRMNGGKPLPPVHILKGLPACGARFFGRCIFLHASFRVYAMNDEEKSAPNRLSTLSPVALSPECGSKSHGKSRAFYFTHKLSTMLSPVLRMMAGIIGDCIFLINAQNNTL